MFDRSIAQRPLAYELRLEPRNASDVDLVVIHCTELPDLDSARELGGRILYPKSQTGNSGHFYIDRDGTSECWVNPLRVAHHVRHFNGRSIGIELVNTGRWPDWYALENQEMNEDYPEPQVNALLRLLDSLVAALPALAWIAGHEDLDRDLRPASNAPGKSVFRKRDPGPMFPWGHVLAHTSLKRMNPENLP